MPFRYIRADIPDAKIYLQSGTLPGRLTSTRDKNNYKRKWDGLVRHQIDLVILHPKNKKIRKDQDFGNFVPILVVIDELSKYIFARVLKSKSASDVLKAIKSIYRTMRNRPKIVQSDNGTEFKNKTLTAYFKSIGIIHTFGRSYTPTDQSIVERVNRTIKTSLARYSTQYGFNFFDNPEQDVLNMVNAYNMSYHSTIKSTKQYNL
eukprot:TRINITY_DN230_c2_g2_i2.p1 TRINITY_DN230_c2_g2~~TRINITY_DN230_c2_g2_i2.p1  ORF type:complete len:205 (-),score=-6.07 TRINITY_DN230_c2_g2_i2:8-622(-)